MLSYRQYKKMLRYNSPYVSCNKSKELYQMYCETEAKCQPKCEAPSNYTTLGLVDAGAHLQALYCNSFANINLNDCSAVSATKPACNKEEEVTSMNYASAVTVAQTATPIENKRLDYLLRRVEEAYEAQKDSLTKLFHLYPDDTPTTFAEALARFTAGQYILDEAEVAYGKKYGYGWTHGLEWRDPAKPADQAGYEAAKAELKKERTATKDIIMVGTAEEGLASVQALEEWKPTGKAN